MALSVDRLLTDAHTLVVHLKDHDVLADSIITSTQTLYNKIEAMKQYQDDIAELNEIAKHQPRSTLVLGLAQENHQIRELQQENRELQAALEEHQSALELIMQKYREHTVKLLQSNKLERAIHEQEAVDKDSMCQLMDKIDEMAGVMQKAIEMDEREVRVDEERLSRLEVENKALREMLEICTTAKERIIPYSIFTDQRDEGNSDNEDYDDDDDKTDTEGDSSILTSPNMSKNNDEGEKEDEPKQKDSKTDSSNKTDGAAVVITTDATKENPTGSSSKLLGSSKSAGDMRKGKAVPSGKADGATPVKKATSSTGVKKELSSVKKSPSVEVKKDLKGKASPKTVFKK